MKIFKNSKIIILILIVGIFLSLFFFTNIFNTNTAEASWYSSGGVWSYRKPIVVDKNKVATSTGGTVTAITNFPMLVSVIDPNLKFTDFGGSVASSTGGDIIFTNGSGDTLLNFEIEKYASTTGELIAWVNIPFLSSTSTTPIYMYFGNVSAPNNQNPSGTWGSNYSGGLTYDTVLALDGKYWLDRNLGATRVATSKTDASSYGWLFQWGRPVDGHQITTSGTTATLSSSDVPGNSSFITINSGLYDWRSPQNNNLWQGVNGTNNVCPTGFRLPTQPEWAALATAEGITNGTSDDKAFASRLKLSLAGYRYYADGSVSIRGVMGLYWSSSPDGISAYNLAFSSSNVVSSDNGSRAIGFSVRCVADSSWATNFGGKVTTIHTPATPFSADWMRTEWNNQSSPSTFYSYGAREQQNRTTASGKISGSAAVAGGPGWYASGGTWQYRKKLTIDKNKVATSTGGTVTALTSFPVLVSLTQNDLKYTGSGGKVASSTGGDIIFTDSSGATLSNFEIEKYASTTGELVAWVNIPFLSSTSTTPIYMYFGNASAPSNQNPTLVWDANYKGVWHLPNGTTLSTNDSTSGNTNLTNNNSVTAGTGKFDGAGSWDGSLRYLSHTAYNPVTTVVTACLWLKTSAANAFLVSFNRTALTIDYQFTLEIRDNYLIFWDYNFSQGGFGFDYTTANNTAINNNNWHYACFVKNGTSGTYYLDGIVNGTKTAAVNIDYSYGIHTLYVGENVRDSNGAYNGLLDELRISSTPRTADWIKTEYNNQNSPSTFFGVGGLENVGGRVDAGGAATPTMKVRGGVKFR